MKLNHGNFRVEIPVPKELIERKAFLAWESKGRPMSSPQQQKQDYEDALIEVQNQIAKGISLNELHSSFSTSSTKRVVDNREQLKSGMTYSYKWKHNVDQWLQNHTTGPAKTTMTNSALMDLVDKSMGGDDVVSRRSYHVGNYEVVVLSKMVRGEHHILVATNMRGATVLHWGVSKLSPGEWLVPPPEILPKKSNVVPGACQTNFTEMSIGNGSFQVAGAGEGIVKWLLDEISRREKEAERSLMHRFNVAMELTDFCKSEGELALIGMLVWLRFMSCRHLTWNKNYNVKPREISEAQDRFTSLLQRVYLNQPRDQDVVRLLMAHVGRGVQGDVGQKIRDEILVIQKTMTARHRKLHNNSSPDDVIICEALLNYIKSGFRIDVYWKTLNTNGLTKEKLASYDRPIVSEPHFRADTKEGLIHDLTAYLKTLKAVHSSADLESAIEVLVPSNRGHDFTSTVCDLSPRLQEYLNFVKAHHGDEDIVPLREVILCYKPLAFFVPIKESL